MGRRIEPQSIALIVEADFEQRGLAAALLEETELRVVEAASAEEALHYLSGNGEAVAFLFAAVQEPGAPNGLDLAHTVRERWPWVRTVLTSAGDLQRQRRGVPREVRLMPKPWLALDVLIEAEKAAERRRLS